MTAKSTPLRKAGRLDDRANDCFCVLQSEDHEHIVTVLPSAGSLLTQDDVAVPISVDGGLVLLGSNGTIRQRLIYEEYQMADLAKYAITTFQRQPGLWRASITRTDRRPCVVSRSNGKEMLSIVTPSDSESEDAAGEAARAVLKKL